MKAQSSEHACISDFDSAVECILSGRRVGNSSKDRLSPLCRGSSFDEFDLGAEIAESFRLGARIGGCIEMPEPSNCLISQPAYMSVHSVSSSFDQ